MNIQFQYPQAFWLLLLLPFFVLLFILYRRWRTKAAKRLGDPQLVKELYKNYAPTKSVIKFLLVLIAFACGCIALAHPRKPETDTGENRRGIDIVFALDVSNSMLATDVSPTRLTQAKQLVLQLINLFPDDRIGLVLFAGNAYLQVPLTFDHNAAKMFLSTAGPATISQQGTAIGDALQKSDLAFDKQLERFKTVILITDGETHDADALSTAKDLAAHGIIINTIGIGSPLGATIPDTTIEAPKKDADGNVVISKLNQSLLQQIATATNGIYVYFENTGQTIKALQQQLAQVPKKAMADISAADFKTYYQWLAAPMLLLLVAGLFVSNRKKKSV